jgi:hypothetical protein
MKQAMDWRSDQTLPSPPQRGWARFLDVGSLRASGLQGASKGEYKVWCQWWYTFLGTVFISFSAGSVNQKKKKKVMDPRLDFVVVGSAEDGTQGTHSATELYPSPISGFFDYRESLGSREAGPLRPDLPH